MTRPAVPTSTRAGAFAIAVVLLAGVGFAAASLLPWRHLIGFDYVLEFSGFTAALAAIALLLQQGLRRALGGRAVGTALLAALLVYLPVWAWNRKDIDVILLHLDSLRAADCSAYGYGRETTPHIDALARTSAVRFEHFFSQSCGTDKSTPAMLAGIYPSMFYDPAKDENNFLVPDWFPLVGRYLVDDGYTSLAFSSNPQISLRRNYGSGFDAFEELWNDEPRPAELTALLQRRLEQIDGPVFYFGLYIDPHLPYTPKPEFDLFSEPDSLSPPLAFSEVARRLSAGEKPAELPAELVQTMQDDYDGEIREVDAAIGTLVDGLRASGRFERTMLILTGDHGEKFCEHDEMGHGATPYEEVIHVPLVWTFPSPLRFPELRPRHDVYSGLCSHVDLLPTILGYLGIEPPPSERPLQGRDLTPWLYGDAPPPEDSVLVEELVSQHATRCLRSRTRKAILRENAEGRRKQELYDVTSGKDVRIVEGERDVLEAMVAEIDRRVARLKAFYQDKPDERPVDAKTLKKLHQLGYVR